MKEIESECISTNKNIILLIRTISLNLLNILFSVFSSLYDSIRSIWI